MKKALLVVSFGTTCIEADESCIRPVEAALSRAFPDYALHRAFTSHIIIKKLRNRGIAVDHEIEALEKLHAEGYDEIAVIPTSIIPGGEYASVKASASSHPVSEALLESEEDLQWMAELLGRIADEEKRPLLLMAHGTEHASDALYFRLRNLLPKRVYLACATGQLRLEELLPTLEKLPGRRLTLMPLMLTAGCHARREMAGDGKDSWISILKTRGFDVRIRMQGLGALDAVQHRFIKKAEKLLQTLSLN